MRIAAIYPDKREIVLQYDEERDAERFEVILRSVQAELRMEYVDFRFAPCREQPHDSAK